MSLNASGGAWMSSRTTCIRFSNSSQAGEAQRNVASCQTVTPYPIIRARDCRKGPRDQGESIATEEKVRMLRLAIMFPVVA